MKQLRTKEGKLDPYRVVASLVGVLLVGWMGWTSLCSIDAGAASRQATKNEQSITKLQEEIAYREKRIEELKEPKAVMPSSLAQGITNQTTSYSTTPGISATPSSSVPMGSGRRICPNCGASGFAVKEVEDKTRIISYIPKPIYAKKLVCTKCGFEF